MPSWTLPLLKGNPMWGQRLSSANTRSSYEQSSSGRSSPRTVIICFPRKSASDAARKNSAESAGRDSGVIQSEVRVFWNQKPKTRLCKASSEQVGRFLALHSNLRRVVQRRQTGAGPDRSEPVLRYGSRRAAADHPADVLHSVGQSLSSELRDRCDRTEGNPSARSLPNL